MRPEDVILRLDPGMHAAQISRISVSADGRLMAPGSHDKTIKIWALPQQEGETARLIRSLRPPIGPGLVERFSRRSSMAAAEDLCSPGIPD